MNLSAINWSLDTYRDFLEHLNSFSDERYRRFHSSLIPDVPIENLIGIRTPILRKIGKDIFKGDYKAFLEVSGDRYYEEIILKAVVVSLIKTNDFQEIAKLLDFYTPFVNNWATCDLFCSSFKEVKKYKNELLPKLREYLNSENPWFVRVALVLLLTYYLDDNFIKTALELTDIVKSEFYYVSMAQAWLVATAFAKNENFTMDYFLKCKLNDVTFKRTIQKAKESYRVSKECKEKLTLLKRTLDK